MKKKTIVDDIDEAEIKEANQYVPQISILISPTLRIRNDSMCTWVIETRSFRPAGTVGTKGRGKGKLYEEDSYGFWMFPKYYTSLAMAVEKLVSMTLVDEHCVEPLEIRDNLLQILTHLDKATTKLEKTLKELDKKVR